LEVRETLYIHGANTVKLSSHKKEKKKKTLKQSFIKFDVLIINLRNGFNVAIK